MHKRFIFLTMAMETNEHKILQKMDYFQPLPI